MANNIGVNFKEKFVFTNYYKIFLSRRISKTDYLHSRAAFEPAKLASSILFDNVIILLIVLQC